MKKIVFSFILCLCAGLYSLNAMFGYSSPPTRMLAGRLIIENQSGEPVCYSLKRGGTFAHTGVTRTGANTYTRVGAPQEAIFCDRLESGQSNEYATSVFGVTLRFWHATDAAIVENARRYHEGGVGINRQMGLIAAKIWTPAASAGLSVIKLLPGGESTTEFNECVVCTYPLDTVSVVEDRTRPVNHTNISVFSCGHAFHTDCMRRWLVEHETCPHCRFVVGHEAPAPITTEMHLVPLPEPVYGVAASGEAEPHGVAAAAPALPEVRADGDPLHDAVIDVTRA